MANYIDTLTGAYPVSEQTIRQQHANTSFTNPFVPPEEYAVVFPSPTPDYDPITQAVREIGPVFTSKGHYEQQWEVLDLVAETIAANQEAARKARVPHEVTMRQARLALLAAGKLATVDGAIDLISEPQRSAARIEWEYSSAVRRDNPFVAVLGAALGMTSEAMDDLFIAAAAL